MPGRSPLTAYGNVRVGPPAMSLIHSQFFSDCISAVQETQLQPKRVLQAESEGAFFSSESVEKKRTGWFGQPCLQTAGMPTRSDGSAKACLLTAGMPTRSDGSAKA